MDGFSLLVGGLLGIMAGWAFSLASIKRREASKKRRKASEAQRRMAEKEQEAKSNHDSSLMDKAQGFLLNVLGFGAVVFLGVILISSIG